MHVVVISGELYITMSHDFFFIVHLYQGFTAVFLYSTCRHFFSSRYDAYYKPQKFILYHGMLCMYSFNFTTKLNSFINNKTHVVFIVVITVRPVV